MIKVISAIFILIASNEVIAATGILRFNGAIVAGVCTPSVTANSMSVKCIRQGKAKSLKIRTPSTNQTLPYDLGMVKTYTIGNIKNIDIDYK
ncbi:hypothetical protein IB231_21990 [Pantoea sp. PNT02]|uniref:hypothetical protein n=1 Tax=Pantoea sp. PNT02 TaxID=2769261 RepID=UPI00177CB8A5|nr:hypothetical protein [Pantoea sp. PNT02]MBD9646296.1 hypothetical protein [Pantoea sp. PNT02]